MLFFNRNICEGINIASNPKFQLNEIDEIYEEVLKNLDTNLKIPPNILDSFKINKTLNPDVWDEETIKPLIKKQLTKISVDFLKELDLEKDIKIKDILLVGSLANYNWSKYSDFDLHIVIDFSKFDEDEDFIQKFFDLQKNSYNLKHDITIKDYPVELYVQDVKVKLYSSAVYSIKFDKWVIKPEKVNFKLDKKLIKSKIAILFDKLKNIEKDYKNNDFESVTNNSDKLMKSIKNMRKSGLESGGEFSTENIIFKILRRTNFIEILQNFKNKSHDKLLTIEEDEP